LDDQDTPVGLLNSEDVVNLLADDKPKLFVCCLSGE